MYTVIFILSSKAEKSQGSFLRNLQQLVKIPEIPIFLLFMMLLGSNWGFTENYLFIFLSDELKAPTYLLGKYCELSDFLAHLRLHSGFFLGTTSYFACSACFVLHHCP